MTGGFQWKNAQASLLFLATWPVGHLTSVVLKFSDQREAASHS